MGNINSFTVIILTYNNFNLMHHALESLSKQKKPPNILSQLVIVDDGSECLHYDEINELIRDYGLEEKFRVNLHINEKNLGTVKSFNLALSIADGDVIIPLSADDELYDDSVICDILKFFSENESANIVTCLRAPIISGEEVGFLPSKEKWHLFESSSTLYKYITFRGNFISGASTYYRRNLIIPTGFDQNYRYIEDFPFFLRQLLAGEKIYLFRRISIRYGTNGVSSRISRNSIVYTDYKKIWLDIMRVNKRRGLFYLRFVYFNHVILNTGPITFSIFLRYPEQVIFRFGVNLINWLRRNHGN